MKGVPTLNKVQLRRKRIQIKAERMAILRKIDELQDATDHEKDKKKREKIKTDIQELGKELERKVVASISDHDFATNEEFQDFGRKRKAWSMPVEKYIKYKKRGLLDKEIILAVKNPEKLEIVEIYSAEPSKTVNRLKEKLLEKAYAKLEKDNTRLRRLQVSLSKGDLKVIQAKKIY